jgi:hypothetical protein
MRGMRVLLQKNLPQGRGNQDGFRTLKESKDLVGEPQSLMRESRAPESFGSYLAMVTSITDFEPTTFAQEANQQVWR